MTGPRNLVPSSSHFPRTGSHRMGRSSGTMSNRNASGSPTMSRRSLAWRPTPMETNLIGNEIHFTKINNNNIIQSKYCLSYTLTKGKGKDKQLKPKYLNCTKFIKFIDNKRNNACFLFCFC